MNTRVIHDEDFSSFALDEDFAVIQIEDKKFLVDYSLLSDMLFRLAQVSAEMERKTQTPSQCRSLN